MKNATITRKQLTRPVPGLTYYFYERHSTKEAAKEIALFLNGDQHAYYVAVKEKGEQYFDVRLQIVTKSR